MALLRAIDVYSVVLLAAPEAASLKQASDSWSLSYGTPSVTKLHQDDTPGRDSHMVRTHGIVGIFPIGAITYVIAITGRENAAIIEGRQAYVITQVIFIPLDSQEAADKALTAASKEQGTSIDRDSGYATDDSDHVTEDDSTASPGQEQKQRDAAALEAPKTPTQSVEKGQTATNKASLGQFAQKWFSKGQSTSANNEKSVASPGATDKTKQAENDTHVKDETTAGTTTIDTYRKRIVRTIRLYLTSKSFFFSYDYDLSKALSHQAHEAEETPLCQRFSPDVFWNKHLLELLISVGAHSFALPLIQGFVGQRTFTIQVGTSCGTSSGVMPASVEDPGHDKSRQFQLAIISRRSVHRAGLRYLRRGTDDRGNVANYVETEHILSEIDASPSKSSSLVQLRGSIPLFFSQSPYSFKPVPQIYGSDDDNIAASTKHFEKLVEAYGNVQVVSLVDGHGTEAAIGQRYEDTTKLVNDRGGATSHQIGFRWFDFHSECRGMHFEKISILLKDIEEVLGSFGWNTIESGRATKEQKGVVRTNCMDCLDRTNVTQSAISGWVLQQQLGELGLEIDLQADKQSIWFNQLWADNGDAISRQYAGTAALKGDFTRTRKRNWKGAVTDFSLTLNRYYNNIFGDYFLQTCIDYMLGNVGTSIFDDFESEMTIKDHALDMDRIRQNAIDVCAKIVLEDADEKFSGWTLSCPASANTLRSMPFEECVLLLTAKAVYFCRFDWKSDKVGSFERIDLDKMVKIWRGVYITSALGIAKTDEKKNVGFVLQYDTGGRALIRTNTRTIDNEQPVSNADEVPSDSKVQGQSHTRFLAFKIPGHVEVANAAESEQATNEQQLCRSISNSIAEAINAASEATVPLAIEEQDIVSLADAQKATSYAESISYSLKKLIW